MKLRYLIFTIVLTARCAAGAVQLSSLNSPTLATLIAMGSTPVAVGPYQFSDFGFIDASSPAALSAAHVRVMSQPDNGYGLEFVTNLFAADGNRIDVVLSYDVATTDPTQSIGQIDLLSNATAPAPAPGTFTTTTLVSQLPTGATASPVLSTYNDGFTVPVDTTKPDVNFTYAAVTPKSELLITDTYIAISTPADSSDNGGVTTASILENTFVPIPEPAGMGWVTLLAMTAGLGLSRPQRQGPGIN